MTNHANFTTGLPERLPNRRYDGNILTAQTCRAITEINSTDLNGLWDSRLRSRCLLVPRQLNGTWWRHGHCLSASRTAQRLRDRRRFRLRAWPTYWRREPGRSGGDGGTARVGVCVLGGGTTAEVGATGRGAGVARSGAAVGGGGGAKVGRADAAVLAARSAEAGLLATSGGGVIRGVFGAGGRDRTWRCCR